LTVGKQPSRSPKQVAPSGLPSDKQKRLLWMVHLPPCSHPLFHVPSADEQYEAVTLTCSRLPYVLWSVWVNERPMIPS
jgi:hypothetical protein